MGHFYILKLSEAVKVCIPKLIIISENKIQGLLRNKTTCEVPKYSTCVLIDALTFHNDTEIIMRNHF